MGPCAAVLILLYNTRIYILLRRDFGSKRPRKNYLNVYAQFMNDELCTV